MFLFDKVVAGNSCCGSKVEAARCGAEYAEGL